MTKRRYSTFPPGTVIIDNRYIYPRSAIMEKPTIYRGDGYLPDPIIEMTAGNLHDLIPKIEAAARLGADIELITERTLDAQHTSEDNAVLRRRFRLKVFPREPDSDAEVLASLALQHERRQVAFDGLSS